MQNPKVLAILTVIFWSFSSTFARLISLSSPYLLFCMSFVFALIIYLAYAGFLYKGDFIRKLKRIPARYFLIGLFGYYAIWVGNTESFLSYNSASETTVLNYTWLIFTVFFSQLFFRPPSSINARFMVGNLGVLFCFLAVYFLAVEGRIGTFDFSNTRGLFWGLAGGMAYGFFSAYSSKIPKEEHPLFLIAAISSSLLAMLATAIFRNDSFAESVLKITAFDVLIAFAMGVLVDAFGYVMWTGSLRQASKLDIDISKVASIIFFLPVLSLVIVSIVFGENTIFKDYFLFSLVFLLSGIFLSQKAELISGFITKNLKS